MTRPELLGLEANHINLRWTIDAYIDTILKHGGMTTTFIQPRDAMSPSEDTSNKTRVLIVDDEVAIARILNRVLKKHHEVTVCHDGQSALDLIESGEKFDAILCDMLMPGLSGMDFYDWLTTHEPDQARRLLFTTGGAFSERARSYQDKMPERFIHKPFNIRELSPKLIEFIASQH